MTNINCQSSNIIYLITCTTCGIQYVGQTKNRLLTRFQGHHFDIKNQNDTTVSCYFNRCPSSRPAGFDGLEISVLSFIKNPSNSKGGQLERDREEKRWIHRLATLELNILAYRIQRRSRLYNFARIRTDLRTYIHRTAAELLQKC